MKVKTELLGDNHKQFMSVLDEAANLRFTKLMDYGLSYKNFGPLGVAVRMDDKMSRIKNILKNGKVNHESLRDSAIDMVNYAAMLVMEIDDANVQCAVSPAPGGDIPGGNGREEPTDGVGR